MQSLDHSIKLAAPAATVFAYLTEAAKASAWQSSLVEARFTPPGPMQVGTHIAEVRTLLGRTLASDVEVTELEPPRYFAGRAAAGPVQWRFRYSLAEQDGQTTLGFHLEGDLGRLFRLAGPLVLRAMRHQLDADLATLRGLVEAAD